MNIPDPKARTVRLQVTIEDGHCILADGRPLPKLTNNTPAELIFRATALLDPEDRAKYSGELREVILPIQAELWARVKSDAIENRLAVHRVPKDIWGVGNHKRNYFVSFHLMQDLYLVNRVGKSSILEECKCYIPAREMEVSSVNEAYTRISEVFEPERRSHAGNVFRDVFFEHGLYVYPLERLRSPEEHELITTVR
jgi:hypothetical protein